MMRGLPKLALARLKASAGKPKSASPPWGPDPLPAGEHLDPNLLAAFVEKSLTGSERVQVLNHLSQCAECREAAALSLPAEGAVAEPIGAPAATLWRQWPVLRWGAMAATLAALAFIMVLHPAWWRGRPEMTGALPTPAPAANLAGAARTMAPSPSAPSVPEDVRAQAQAAARKSGGEMTAAKASSSPQASPMKGHVAHAKAKQPVTLMASNRPPTANRGLLAPAPSPARDAETTGASEDALSATAASRASVESARTTTSNAAAVEGNTGASSAQATSARALQPRAARTTYAVMAAVPVVKMRAVRSYAGGSPTALWSVASDGRVLRSTDGGKTFEAIDVAPGIKFRAIVALAGEVWAGGTGGALFHSVDGGATWNRTLLSSEGNTVTETIARIEWHDPQHLTLTTASGSQWTSDDGGRHWQKQP